MLLNVEALGGSNRERAGALAEADSNGGIGLDGYEADQ